MKLKFYYIFFLLWSHILYGTPIDSLYQLLEQTSTTSQIHLTTHLELADALQKQGEDSTALGHITIVEKQLIERNFPIVKVHLLLTKGLLAHSQYKDEEALDLFEEGYQLNKQYQAGFCVDFCINLSKLTTASESKNYIKKGLDCALDVRDTIALQKQLGNIYTQQEQYAKAIELYTSNKQLAQNIKDTLVESNAYQNIGVVHLLEGDWKRAINSYLKSSSLKEKMGDQKGVAHVHHNIAMVYFNQNQYDESLEYYQKCVDYYSNNKDTAELLEIWNNTAGVYIAQAKYDTATRLLNQILPLLEKFPNPTVALKAQMNLGDIYLQKENYPKALELFEATLQAAQQQEDYLSITGSYNFLGLVYFHLNEYKTSIGSYQEALNLSQELDLLYEQGIALYGLYETHSYLGNFREALDWHKQYTSIKDSLYNVEITTQIAAMQADYDHLRQENEIKQLKLEDKTIALANATKTKQFYGTLAVVGLLLVLGLLLWGYRHQQQQALLHQQKMKELLREQEIKILSAVVAAQQQERNYLAQEVHDTLGNSLAVLRMKHESMNDLKGEDAHYHQKYVEMEEMIDKMAIQLRTITHELYTGEQFSFDLEEELELLVSRVRNGAKLDIELFIYMPIELARNVELVLYRVVQESLSNIVRHAQATEVTVQINQIESETILTIEDNGRGFDATLPSQGIGLDTMRNRVKTVDGIFNVDSSPKSGTIIIVEIPID